VASNGLHEVHEAILASKYNFGAPRVSVDLMRSDGTLVLRHDASGDGRGLDVARAKRVLDYIASVWRRPVELYTVDEKGAEACVTPTTAAAKR